MYTLPHSRTSDRHSQETQTHLRGVVTHLVQCKKRFRTILFFVRRIFRTTSFQQLSIIRSIVVSQSTLVAPEHQPERPIASRR